MKHVHYDKIVAKAENMDLVVFFNPLIGSNDGKWEEATTTLFPAFHPETDYFLCLPQHKEACLHWLNGGDVEFCDVDSWYSCDGWSVDWFGETCGFMQEGNVIRVKRNKAKRFIVYRNGTIYGEFLSIREINDDLIRTGQIIEIEVEV